MFDQNSFSWFVVWSDGEEKSSDDDNDVIKKLLADLPSPSSLRDEKVTLNPEEFEKVPYTIDVYALNVCFVKCFLTKHDFFVYCNFTNFR